MRSRARETDDHRDRREPDERVKEGRRDARREEPAEACDDGTRTLVPGARLPRPFLLGLGGRRGPSPRAKA